MFKLEFDFDKLTAKLDRFAEVVEGSIRGAAQAGAQVYYDEMRILAARSERGWGKGTLSRAIYQAYATKHSTPDKAVYHISWRKGAGAKLSGMPTAGHGNLIEYGFWQRYKMGKNEHGKFIGPLVREGMEGKPKPKPESSRAVKDAYWQTLPSPIWHPPRSFLRASYEAKKAEAAAAADREMQERILKAFL